jgi:hypothetical protein
MITGLSILQRTPGATVVVAPYGPRGPVIAGTSPTAVSIAIGSATFAMNEYGLGFTTGIRLRATAIGAASQGIEGVVTSYTGTFLTILADLISGGGIYSSWQISVAGQPGIQGPTGSTGPASFPDAPLDSGKYVRLNAAWYNILTDLATYQPLDADLTAIAGLTGIGVIYYRSAAGIWSPITIGSGIAFAGGVISSSAGGGNVSNSGVPVAGQTAQWINTQQIKGVVSPRILIQRFITSGTYTPTANLIYAIIECLGGGAGGGGVAAAIASITQGGGGGGAGSYSRAVKTAAQIGASQVVTIGIGGPGGAAGQNNGSPGGDTSVGVLVVGKGALGGTGGAAGSNVAPGGLGGIQGIGDVTGTGANGLTTCGFAGGNPAIAGAGAASPFGGGGFAPNAFNGAGTPATGFGAGGSGAISSNVGTANAGGAGSPGLVIITEYCSS